MSFFNNVVKFFYAKPYKIGPSNASQEQHRRKDATEQIKKQTLARTRTQVLGISSADALPTWLRVPVGGTEFIVPIRFQILNSLRCHPFMWTFILDMLLIVFYSFFIFIHC